MKTLILILISFLIGAFAAYSYASYVKTIEVPEYINGYLTLDLLDYLSTLKVKQDAIDKSNQPLFITPTKKEVKGIMSAQIMLDYER